MLGSDSTLLGIAKAMASHAAEVQAVAARNIAHADTPGYEARAAERFDEAYANGRAAPRVSVDATAPADASGNSVSIEAQVFALSEARGQHDLALGLWEQTLGLYRTALGRGR